MKVAVVLALLAFSAVQVASACGCGETCVTVIPHGSALRPYGGYGLGYGYGGYGLGYGYGGYGLGYGYGGYGLGYGYGGYGPYYGGWGFTGYAPYYGGWGYGSGYGCGCCRTYVEPAITTCISY